MKNQNLVVLTPTSAASRSRSASAARDRSEGRSGGGESCYFPGCRKDTNCHCDICLASIDATRDLVVPSGSTLNKSSLSRVSVSRPLAPLPFDADADSPPATPHAGSSVTPPATPPTIDSSDSIQDYESDEEELAKEESGKRGSLITRVLGGLFLLWAVSFGISAVKYPSEFSPKLTPGMVRLIADESRALENDLSGKLANLQRRLEGVVGVRVSNCSSADSLWELNQESQFLLQWRCTIYKSIAEKVTVWGSPLRTSGLLATGFSSKSMTILSGEITEWSDVKLLSTRRSTGNTTSSWTRARWSSAALQLDADTWVLEYERSALLEGEGLVPAAFEALRLGRLKLKLRNFRLRMLDLCFSRRHCSRRKRHFVTPT